MEIITAIALIVVSLIGIASFFVDKSSRSDRTITLEKEAWDKFVEMGKNPKRASQWLLEGMNKYNQNQGISNTKRENIVFPSLIKLDPMKLDGKFLKMSVTFDTNPNGQTVYVVMGKDENNGKIYILNSFSI